MQTSLHQLCSIPCCRSYWNSIFVNAKNDFVKWNSSSICSVTGVIHVSFSYNSQLHICSIHAVCIAYPCRKFLGWINNTAALQIKGKNSDILAEWARKNPNLQILDRARWQKQCNINSVHNKTFAMRYNLRQ